MIPLVELREVGVSFGKATVLSSVSMRIEPGASIGISGRSGSGKSTLARLLTLHLAPSQGTRLVMGSPVAATMGAQWRSVRRKLQLVTQDPANSFVSRWTVREILEEARRIEPADSVEDCTEMLEAVQLPGECWERRPLALSGGQRCRLALARALMAKPELLVLDETLSPLDRPLRDDICRLLREIQNRSGLAVVVISHDLRLLKEHCRDWIILENGRVAEQGAAAEVLARPAADETKALVEASFLRSRL